MKVVNLTRAVFLFEGCLLLNHMREPKEVVLIGVIVVSEKSQGSVLFAFVLEYLMTSLTPLGIAPPGNWHLAYANRWCQPHL